MPGAVRTSIGVRGIPREEAHDVTSWVDGLGGDAPGRAGEALRGDAADPSNSDGTYKLGYLLHLLVSHLTHEKGAGGRGESASRSSSKSSDSGVPSL